MNTNDLQVFLDAITITPDGCWEWRGKARGPRRDDGSYSYGTFHKKYTHRLAYEHWKGTIPPDHEIDHVCRNTRCCNPDHLEAVTHQENMRRWRVLTTHCPKGHPYDETNTFVRDGARYCRICSREWALARYHNFSDEQRAIHRVQCREAARRYRERKKKAEL